MSDFEPGIEGIRREGLFQYQDELGDVYLTSAGGMPERMFAFYYKDAKYEFCFYADCKYEGKKFDIEVQNATIYRLHGPRPKIDPADFDRIRRNMARFFSERWFLSVRRPVPPTEELRSVKLAWVLP